MDSQRVWAEISLQNLIQNYKEVRKLVGNRQIMAVVKANAYGHGAAKIASVLQNEGADRFAVATIDEAEKLRMAGITVPVMILGATHAGAAKLLLEYDIIQNVYSLEEAEALSKELGGSRGRLKVHVKVDTGMSRLGFISEGGAGMAAEEIEKVFELKNLEVEGMFTHFATSEVIDDDFSRVQLQKFREVADELTKRGRCPAVLHAANSGAVINMPEAYFDMVRPGIILYGLYPGVNLESRLQLKPVMSLHTRITQIHNFENPVTVSYGRTYETKGRSRIAVVAIGYADGLHRTLSNKLEVLVRGRRVRQIGNICMDMMMLDITGMDDVQEGDIVTIFGTDGDEEITLDELARKIGTINYELMCSLSDRVERIYIEG